MSEVPLRDYFDKRLCELDRRLFQAIEERDKRIDVALQAAKDAVVVAKETNERRLALLNEFRAQSSDEARKYALSQVIEHQFVVVAERIVRLEQRVITAEHSVALLQGRALALAGVGSLLAGLASALAVKFLG